MEAYKFMREGAVSPFSGVRWAVGEWMEGGPGAPAACRQGVQGPRTCSVYGSGVAMVAKLLLLIALLAPILTVAAGVLAHRAKKPERKSRGDKQ